MNCVVPVLSEHPEPKPIGEPESPLMAETIHRLFAEVRSLPFPVSRRDVPADGIYLLYEAGETVMIGGQALERIVGVGTHSGDGRLARRLGIHASGDRRGSDVRLHIGSALLARQGAPTGDLRTWVSEPRTPMPNAEAAVSAELRERFAVRCLPVPTNDERQSLTKALGWLLARDPAGAPSADWLGRQASRPEVNATGLWIIPPGDWQPFRHAQFERLAAIVTPTSGTAESDDQA